MGKWKKAYLEVFHEVTAVDGPPETLGNKMWGFLQENGVNPYKEKK